jgi:hypothetical protein
VGVAIDGPLWADFWLAEVSGMLAMRDGWTYGAWFRCLILTSRLTAYDSYLPESGVQSKIRLSTTCRQRCFAQ